MVDQVTSVRFAGLYRPVYTSVPDTGSSFSSVATGLWQQRTGWPTCLPCTPTPVGT